MSQPNPPRYVFIDECEGRIDDHLYHAAVATVWDSSQLKPFRAELMKSISDLVNSKGTVGHLPSLHGSGMAPGYNDDVKLSCFRILADLIAKFGVDIYRLGYFDVVPAITTVFDSLATSISQVSSEIGRRESGDLVFVYELNISKHKKIASEFNDTKNHFLAAAIGSQNVSIPNLDKILGRFYCDKENVFMAATDIASYYLLQREKMNAGQPLGAFVAQAFQLMTPLDRHVAGNEVIQMNAWPISPTPDGPIRYMFPIVPSDTTDVGMSNEFRERLREYWKSEIL